MSVVSRELPQGGDNNKEVEAAGLDRRSWLTVVNDAVAEDTKAGI